jgi:GAF domain-containing protein
MQAATAELAQRVDQVQYDTGQGPCLDAIREQRTVRVSDMRTETRWPQFTRRAAQLGVVSTLSFQLFVQRDNLGSLNLCAQQADAFDDESEHVGLLVAAHAAVALSGAQHQQHLSTALGSRDLIGQAKGILMERYKLTAGQAFAVLARTSQESNTKLVNVARTVAETRSARDRR